MKIKKFISILVFAEIFFVGIDNIFAYCSNCIICEYKHLNYILEFIPNKSDAKVYGNLEKGISSVEYIGESIIKEASDCPSSIRIAVFDESGKEVSYSPSTYVEDSDIVLKSKIFDGKYKRSVLMSYSFLRSYSLKKSYINERNGEYNNYNNNVVYCGSDVIKDLPKDIPRIVSIIYIAIQISVPVVLVIFGMLDLFKGITSQKEDEIKKGQQMFIKRLISAALVFFVLVIVKFVIGIASDKSDIMSCAECLIKNNCDSVGGS